ncbi:hypothetical protein FHX82_005947 [Amycolatopsis bartoniae]|uniref:Uncharacterized protein n=1 Tax=Amycolatopsis bartoniae TaxID=941986 RepID=A0A8H9J012_9PSEU|nr:hypothetical protein [Amycolatopsis bartoniae]MBB2938869.1 hypothetical protein [Amycolatopsis bartoniae]TVT00683.1 hypothetical protein FNH07_31165 [Amycolatopsis bartoniae]GHF77228.1 hypothetical protein GCM10017566_59280 [Amycolatopsis bartoniae]
MSSHHLRWQSLVVPVLVGVAIVVVVWWAGPGLFGSVSASGGTVAEATITTPAACTAADPKETVQFSSGGATHTGSLDACGHDKNDRVEITIPDDLGSGTVNVHLADVVVGHSGLRRPVGLALLALSCLSGAAYAFLVQRGSRRPEAVAA